MASDEGRQVPTTGGINDAGLARLTEQPAKGPVVMLNLLKFKPNGGLESYARYGEAVRPLLANAGGRIVYSGITDELLIGSEEWDMIAVVEYPTRAAFLEMVGSPEYQAIAHLREDALERSVLYATDPAPLDPD